jgi:flagellar basal-body rod protein FlgB
VQRRRALSSNLSNLDTPEYDRLSVSFEDELRKARGPGGIQAEGDVTGRTEVEDGPPILEDELMTLADTQMRTQFASRALREHYSLMRTGITGRSG